MTKRICPKHNVPLTKHGGKLYCLECLRTAASVYETQQAAQKRWRNSKRGKEKIKAHEQGKGKDARSRYLHSTKYKARRKEYNKRIQESLQIARVQLHEATKREPEFTKHRLTALVRDVKDILSWGKRISLAEVTEIGRGYGLDILPEQAKQLVDQARELMPKGQ